MGNMAYFEVPVDSLTRAKKFYSEVLGWTFEKTKTPVPMEYLEIHTGPEQKNTINAGGMYQRTPEMSLKGIMNYVQVENIDQTLAKVEKAGGKIVGQKMEIPKVGFLAFIEDSEGNMFGLWQAG